MLDRYENECRKLGWTSYNMHQLLDSRIANYTAKALGSAGTSLQTAEATTEYNKKADFRLRPEISSIMVSAMACQVPGTNLSLVNSAASSPRLDRHRVTPRL